MAVKVTGKGKRTYTIVLDVEKTDYVKAQLNNAGLSLSSMLRVSIEQLYKVYKAMEKDGKVELGIVEAFQIMSDSMKKMDGKSDV